MLRSRKAVSRRERGAVIVETALACVVLMVLIMATFDFAHMHYARSSLQHAVSQATRYAITGSTVADPSDNTKKLSREASIKYLVQKISGIQDFDEQDIKVYVVQSNGSLTAGPGGPGEVIMVRASYRIGLITPGIAKLFPEGEYAFTCSTRFRNEEFT
jgi:Flp pilus assembly protein TadG